MVIPEFTKEQKEYLNKVFKITFEIGFHEGHDGQPHRSGIPQTDRKKQCFEENKNLFLCR